MEAVIGDNTLRHFLDFDDYFPAMMARMGSEGFIAELINGFRLLMDAEKGLITFESLKRNSLLLGLQDLHDDELVCMVMEGDLDGDGALNPTEFCVLMLRLSPGLTDCPGQRAASFKPWNNVDGISWRA